MQLSHYLKIFESRDNPDECIAFSTKRASIVQLARETLTEIASGDLCREDAELLARLEIIVPDVETEKKAMLAFGRTWGRSSPVLNIVAILNLDCNFACPYCYENGVKGNFYMSRQTADALIAFARQRFDADKKMLLVDFHGGEPLLSLDLIRHISGALKPFVESEGGTYSFTLVTNGSLLNRKTVEALKTLGLESVKITLDGPAELHNSSRPYKSGAGTFDVIVNHIKETCDLVKVNIGGNFEQGNYRRFPELLDVLIDEGLTPDRVGRIKFDPVTASIDRSEALAAYKGGCSCLNEPWLVEAEAFLREAIFARGYRAVK
ncbi:MAG: radical SAM protein, partial [Desulfobacterales bacterium]